MKSNKVDKLEVLVSMLPELELPEKIVGVYFLMKHGRIVYVGQSRDMVARIRSHVYERDNDRKYGKDFDKVRYIQVAPDCLDVCESFLIDWFKPKYNNTGTVSAHLKRRRVTLVEQLRANLALGALSPLTQFHDQSN